jgi:hypothetical protein
MNHKGETEKDGADYQPLETKCQPNTVLGEKTPDHRCGAKGEEEIKSQYGWWEDKRHGHDGFDYTFKSHFPEH